LEDAQILTLVRSGNTGAFTGIVERYQKAIQRYLWRVTGNYQVSQDLAQDTFLQAFESILKSQTDINIKPWLYRIATNNVYQYHRRKKIVSFTSLEDHKMESTPAVDPLNFSEKAEIQEILLKIPDEQRVCLILNIIEGFKCREIALTLSILETAVYKRLERGMHLFRQLYTQG
jgi:RNA polymerase sigma-70 factor, ECF subfamily